MNNFIPEILFLAAAVAAAVLSGSRLWRMNRAEEAQQRRLAEFRGEVTTAKQTQMSWYRQLGTQIAVSPIIGVVERQRLFKLLLAAGIKGRGSLANFIATKVCGAAILAVFAWLMLEWEQIENIWIFLGSIGSAIMFGWRLPDIILSRLVKHRRLRLEQGMPDALDLLVICAESGLSLNQAIGEVSQQLRLSNQAVADEFDATAAEMRVLPDFAQALDNLVERTGLDSLRGLIATLKQSLKFGTPLAESVRLVASEMRAMRHARIEERTARLPVLLAVPMMAFMLPCLLMIVGTPLALRLVDTFKNITFSSGGF
jgi:tight adherence protein C